MQPSTIFLSMTADDLLPLVVIEHGASTSLLLRLLYLWSPATLTLRSCVTLPAWVVLVQHYPPTRGHALLSLSTRLTSRRSSDVCRHTSLNPQCRRPIFAAPRHATRGSCVINVSWQRQRRVQFQAARRLIRAANFCGGLNHSQRSAKTHLHLPVRPVRK